MSFRSIPPIAAGAAVLALAGCGGSSASHGSSPSSNSTSSSIATSRGIANSAPSTRASKQRSVPRTSSTPTTTPTTSPHTLTAPPPTPTDTPPAPDGLRQTTGYATYELCAGGCSGAVPPSLRRALHLPPAGAGSCPVSAGSGPVKPSAPTQLTLTPFVGSAWEGGRVTWMASGYQGPILIRGRELGGPHAVGFGEGHVPYDELQLDGRSYGAPPGQWMSFTRVRSPGCYAYQIDGTGFSEVIVFRAGA